MKHKLQRLKSILTMMTISLVSVFFILAFQATVRAAQPMVAAGEDHTLGLKSDGTVVAVGSNSYGKCDVSSWTDIAQVAAGEDHTLGLKSDGTVVAVGDNSYSQCNVSSWTDIVQVAAGEDHTLGLKSDGTVVAVGDNRECQCNVSSWTDIVQVAGWNHTVGLKSDGTVVAVGDNTECQCNVSSWTDIVQVAAGWNHTVGLKSDGTVVAVGDNNYGQCNLLDWDLGPVLIDPAPDIKANGSDGPVSIPEGDPISVTIELDPGDYPGVQADWWCLAYAPFGWYYYDDTGTWLPGFYVSYQGPLFSLIPPLEVLSMYGLPIGGYTFYFGVDSNRNGNLDEPLYYDSVEVNITPP